MLEDGLGRRQGERMAHERPREVGDPDDRNRIIAVSPLPPSNASIQLRLPAIMPIGRPPPTTLPYVARSALIPNRAWIPPGCDRKPVTTSSKISAVPERSVTSRSSRRNSRGWKSGRRLCTGSTAQLPVRRLDPGYLLDSGVPYSNTSTFSPTLLMIPGAAGIERSFLVPAPGLRRRCRDRLRESDDQVAPGHGPSNSSAPITASEPVLHKPTLSKPVSSQISAATSPASGC